MALTIKNLGKGTLTTGGGTISPLVDAGKSVLIDNIIFVNKHASITYNIKLWISRSSVDYQAYDENLGPASRLVCNSPIALDAGDLLGGKSTGSSVDFLINGVQKDL